MSTNAERARLIRLQMVALGCAVDDIEGGRYSVEERHHLAGGLDTLAAALRAEDGPVVVETEPVERSVGLLEWGSLS